jgi:CrcB protein
MTLVLVALGAAVGAPLRYLVDQWLARGKSWAAGTFAVNVVGSLILGFLVALPADAAWQALAGVGFCGALTTYSTFGYETLRLLRQDAWRGVVYAGASLAVGLAAAYAGLSVADLVK